MDEVRIAGLLGLSMDGPAAYLQALDRTKVLAGGELVKFDIKRPILRATILRLDRLGPDLTAELQRQMLDGPLVKPERHRGGPESDTFRVELGVEQIHQIVSLLGDLESDLVTGEAPPMQVSATADLLDYWNCLDR